MDIQPIKTEADYAAVLREVSALVDIDPQADSPEGDRLDVLVTLVQAWEARHHPIGSAVLVPMDEWLRLKAAARPSLKLLLLTDQGRADLVVPSRGQARRRARAPTR